MKKKLSFLAFCLITTILCITACTPPSNSGGSEDQEITIQFSVDSSLKGTFTTCSPKEFENIYYITLSDNGKWEFGQNSTATITDKSGNEKTSGNLATGDKITIKGSTESISYIIAIRGDNNGDGVIDLKDFVLCQSHILKKMTLADEKFIASDVNYDGVVDLKDFVLIQSHILKKLTL